MNTYANVTRLYCHNGVCSPCLFDVAKMLKSVTVNLKFSCGGQNGTWDDEPFYEIKSKPATTPKEVIDLCTPIERTIETDTAIPLLFDAVCESIAASWNPGAFHVVSHSSGYDSRIISSAIKKLGYADKDVLFLGNRWEADFAERFFEKLGIENYANFTDGEDGNHFVLGLQSVWRNAPCPIPGNLWRYLIEWAESKNLIPTTGVQCYTGLWANEAWNCFLSPNNDWMNRVGGWYSYNCMAALPVKAQQVEYPMVDTRVLSLLRNTLACSGDKLRERVANFANPGTSNIPRLGLDDRNHQISMPLRLQLDALYQSTWFGKHRPWIAPTTSEFSTEWGRYSLAMMIEELIKEGVSVEGK